MSEQQQEIVVNRKSLSEDWVVVIMGFLVIFLSLYVFVSPVPVFSWKDGDELLSVLSAGNIAVIGLQFVYAFIIAGLAVWMTGKSLRSFVVVFPIVSLLTVIALVFAGNSTMNDLNLEAVIFSLATGLIVGNLVKLPAWFRAALSAELFVKIGLVLLGTRVIFTDILRAGGLGLLQALVVVITVWYFAFWLCRKFKLDDELSMMLSSAVSICGVSAAIATAGAIKGDPKKLSYIISLVLVTAIPMMIFMPYIAHYFAFPEEVTGAWLGGSIDTTGAVVAAGTLVGDTAVKISTIVKFSQNVLLGLAAFAISIYWTYTRKDPAGDGITAAEKPTLRLIWDRFPKFVLGFMAASILFSFLIPAASVAAVKDSLKSIQSLWFVLAFTSIGLETKFSDLFSSSSRKPLYAFLIAQLFNILVTLLVAFVLFSPR
ncbi:MAG TPA: putative sulfate exporter family transporter [Ohtaekwangia sp.]|nr:putative sulfate exporter family transporter [Ohtaekwangia sp.]